MADSKEKDCENLSRLIRREIENAVHPLREAVGALEREVELLKRQTGSPVPCAPAKTEKKDDGDQKCGRRKIAGLRRKLKLSKQKFAGLFGVGRDEVNAWENGENKPSGEAAQLLGKLMKMDKKQRAAFLATLEPEPENGER